MEMQGKIFTDDSQYVAKFLGKHDDRWYTLKHFPGYHGELKQQGSETIV